MRRLLVLLSVSVCALGSAGVAAAAARDDGGELVRFTAANDGDVPVYVLDPSGSPLPSPACGFAPTALGGAHLRADVVGWEGPVTTPELGTRHVLLHALVHGTLTDASGAAYLVLGSFVAAGETQWPDYLVPFDGDGVLAIVGAGGVVTAAAEFRETVAGPPEWAFFLKSLGACTAR